MWSNRVLDLYRFPGSAKVWTYITADWAQALLVREEWKRAWTLFEGNLARRSPAHGWWEEEFIASSQGTGDDPHAWAAANFLLWMRALFAREDRDGSIHLLSGIPPEWLDRGVPVTAMGFALSSARLDFLSAAPLPDGRVQVAWNLKPRAFPPPAPSLAIHLHLRGRAILSGECDDGLELHGDSVVVHESSGNCVLAVHPPVARSR